MLSVGIRESVYPRVTGIDPKGAPMGTAQVAFTEAELLADVPVDTPLIAGGVRCHGGFDRDGNYVSPRTRFRPMSRRGCSTI